MGGRGSGPEVDTIAAISSAAGRGAISIVRVSGPQADKVCDAVVGRTDALAPRTPALVSVRDPEDGSLLDRAVATWLEGPRTYTGEDMLELSCHGGWLVPELVLEACVRAGARRAEPGEFTRRAYLRGKLDLVQVEAVTDLVDARGRALHRAAVANLERGLSSRLAALRKQVVGLEALLAHHIDFPEEDDAPVPLSEIEGRARELTADLEALLATAPEGELLREGAVAVLAGRPNVGKSSLFNALIGDERAIVTRHAGTTRDALEVTIQVGGFPFRLIDTAGLRDGGGEVERIGIEVAKRAIGRADVILFCVPRATGATEADLEFLRRDRTTPVLLVETKADLGGDESAAAPSGVAGRVATSVRSGIGLDELKTILPRLTYRTMVDSDPDVPVITRARQSRALRIARDEVGRFSEALAAGLPAEVAATHLRPAESALEDLLGVVSVEDVLDVVFREFCIGK